MYAVIFAIYGIDCSEKKEFIGKLKKTFHTHSFISKNIIHEDNNSIDAFYYLDSSNSSIKECNHKSHDEIVSQKQSEMKELSFICENKEKELVVLDNDFNLGIEFTKFYIQLYQANKSNPEDVARHMLDEISPLLLERKVALVVDCDRTISINDVSGDFLEYLEIADDLVNKIFAKTRYSMYQFYKVFRLYMNFSEEKLSEITEKTYEKVLLKPELLKILESNQDLLCIGISAGVFRAWENIKNNKLNLHALFGNSYEKGYLVTPRVKEALVKLLQEKGLYVVAIGDSIIDLPMLERADNGYLVAYSNIGKGVERYLNTHPNTRIKQLDFSNFYYENIAIENFKI